MRSAVLVLAAIGASGIACSQNQAADVELRELTPACVVSNSDGSNLELLLPYRTRATEFDVSPDGKRITYVWSGTRGTDIWIANIDGSAAQNISNTNGATERGPDWSPDGSMIAFTSDRTGNSEIFLMTPDGSTVSNVSVHSAGDASPTWSPDGKQIAFASNRGGSADIYIMNSDGSSVQNVTNQFLDGASFGEPTWSPDGAFIAFVARVERDRDIYLLNVGSGDVDRLTTSPLPEHQPAWSPTGRRIAYTRNSPEGSDIIVMLANGGDAVNITEGSGVNEHPTWTPDGRIVFFTLRRSQDLHRQLGADTTLVIIEGGGLALVPRAGDSPTVVLQRTTPTGEIEMLPLSKDQAESLLRSRGESYVKVDQRF